LPDVGKHAGVIAAGGLFKHTGPGPAFSGELTALLQGNQL